MCQVCTRARNAQGVRDILRMQVLDRSAGECRISGAHEKRRAREAVFLLESAECRAKIRPLFGAQLSGRAHVPPRDEQEMPLRSFIGPRVMGHDPGAVPYEDGLMMMLAEVLLAEGAEIAALDLLQHRVVIAALGYARIPDIDLPLLRHRGQDTEKAASKRGGL